MMTDSNGPELQLLSLARDRGFQNELAQVRAKAVLTAATREPAPIRWTYDAGRLARNGSAAVFDLERIGLLASDRLSSVEDLRNAALRVAQLWESLACLGESAGGDGALINAALAYELAGYQANAACLASRLLAQGEPEDQSVRLLASFLRRLFVSLREESNALSRPPDLRKILDQEALLSSASNALLARGLSAAASFFLAGENAAIGRAVEDLRRAEAGFASLGAVVAANACRGAQSLLPVMRHRSTWAVLGDIEAGPRWRRYLKLLARGVGEYVLGSPSVSELWPSQLTALEAGLLSSRESMVLRMPTSTGKTRIAELAMVHTLSTQPGARCIYVAPYRALVTELEGSFLNVFADLGLYVSSFAGAYEADEFENRLATEADVLVLTPERLDLLDRVQPEFFDPVRLVVLDEGQIVDDLSRGIKYELLLSRLKARLPQARFLFLSAVVPQETLEDFAAWLEAGSLGIVTSDWRPSVTRIAKFEWRGDRGTVEYAPSGELEFQGQFVHGVIQSRTFDHLNESTGRMRRPRFPNLNNKSETAAELAFQLSRQGPVLVFCPQTNLVESVAGAVVRRLELQELTGQDTPSRFRTETTVSAGVAAEWLGAEHRVTGFLRRGVAVHHGRLPDRVRSSVETDFRKGRYAVLVATNTLAQGVNLPVRTVIVHTCRRRIDDELDERIPARDYWNIAGRAGRAGWETEGQVIHLVANARDEMDYRYFLSKRTDVEPVEGALFKILRALLANRISEDELYDYLDADLLALMVEEDLSAVASTIANVLQNSLVSAQAARRGLEIGPLESLFSHGSQRILSRVPDAERRNAFSDTGLSIASCEALAKDVTARSAELRGLLPKAQPSDLAQLGDLFVSACMRLPEIGPAAELTIDYGVILQSWMAGSGVGALWRELLSDVEGVSVEDVGRFAAEFLSYKLPWGIAAYTRVAAHLLDLPVQSQSEMIRFFPAMVKFGVPTPQAAWAMSMGIPSRPLAIELAHRYLQEAGEKSFSSFREWLGAIEQQQFAEEYGLEGETLERVTQIVSRSGAGHVLRELRGIGELFPIESRVVGVHVGPRRYVAVRAKEGARVELGRDYDNAFDRNAIGVFVDGEELGYLPRQIAQLLAPEMDTGLGLHAIISRKDEGRIPLMQITIEPG